ncbi:hypothetical protein NC651_029759 [Populus alba x Populus x berolinensis]|nr:hypothetical protein NC651_029759 [Populus alba x Populus x berolinensis]
MLKNSYISKLIILCFFKLIKLTTTIRGSAEYVKLFPKPGRQN